MHNRRFSQRVREMRPVQMSGNEGFFVERIDFRISD
jgi:hypothetical protein